MSATSTRALAIPELVQLIFLELSCKELVQPSLVCQLWGEIARRRIWKNVYIPQDLFRILVPFKRRHKYSHIFARAPGPEDWLRFLPVARYVRTLRPVDERDYISSSPPHPRNVLDIITRTRPTTDIFPNLTELHWKYTDTTHPERLFPFLLPQLRVLRMSMYEGSSAYPFNSICAEIVFRCPLLEELYLLSVNTTPVTVLGCQDGICRLLEALPLRILSLPAYYLTASVLLSASKCDSLHSILVAAHLRPSFGASSDNHYRHAQAFNPPITASSCYLNLTSLAIAAPLQSIMNMLNSGAPPPAQLRTLELRAVKPESDATVRALFALLNTQCRELSKLVVVLARPKELVKNEVQDWPAPPRSEVLQLDTIKHLQFPHLTTLKIAHEYALPLSNSELEDVLAGLPRLTCLHLNAAPGNRDPGLSGLTVHVLPRVAAALPMIEDLALLLDAKQLSGLEDEDGVPFKCLRNIFLATSPIDMSAGVSLVRFLARILPTNVEMGYFPSQVSLWDHEPVENGEHGFSDFFAWSYVEGEVMAILDPGRSDREKSDYKTHICVGNCGGSSTGSDWEPDPEDISDED